MCRQCRLALSRPTISQSLAIAKAEQLHHQDILHVSMVAVCIGVGSEEGVVVVGAGGGVDELDSTLPVLFLTGSMQNLCQCLFLSFRSACWSGRITA